MRRQLELYYDAMLAYFSGNQVCKKPVSIILQPPPELANKSPSACLRLAPFSLCPHQTVLEKILAETHVQPANLVAGQSGNIWLDKLHTDMASAVAPAHSPGPLLSAPTTPGPNTPTLPNANIDA